MAASFKSLLETNMFIKITFQLLYLLYKCVLHSSMCIVFIMILFN